MIADTFTTLSRVITYLSAVEVSDDWYALRNKLPAQIDGLNVFMSGFHHWLVVSGGQLLAFGERWPYATPRAEIDNFLRIMRHGTHMPIWWKPEARFAWRIDTKSRLRNELDFTCRYATEDEAVYAADTVARDFGIRRDHVWHERITANVETGKEELA